MAETTTTTTSNKGVKDTDETTTTTTQVVETKPAPTGDEASINYPGGETSPLATRRGEFALNPDAETHYVGTNLNSAKTNAEADEEARVSNIEQSKQDALRAHNLDQKAQATGREDEQSDRAKTGAEEAKSL